MSLWKFGTAFFDDDDYEDDDNDDADDDFRLSHQDFVLLGWFDPLRPS